MLGNKIGFGFILSLVMALGLPSSAFSSGATLIVLPFDNNTGRTEYQWISESFALTLSEILTSPGMVVLSREERQLSKEMAGYGANDNLTLAAKIRVAEAARANLVIIGSFEISGDPATATITVVARMVDTLEGRLIGKSYNFSGPIKDIQSLQGLLAWSILYDRDPALPFSQDQIKRKLQQTPLLAHEFYVKAIQATDIKSSEIFLKRAVKEFEDKGSSKHFAPAFYELGLLNFQQQKYSEAIQYLGGLIPEDARYHEGQFYLGLAQNAIGERHKAAEIFDELAKSLPLIEFLNNGGALQLGVDDLNRAIAYLQRAATAATQDTAIRFNYGYALWRARKYEQAVNEFKTVVNLQPQDGEAYFLLAESLAELGRKAESDIVDQEARRLLSANNTYAQWKTRPDKIPSLIRLKKSFNLSNFYWLVRQRSSSADLPNAQSRLALQYLDQAKTALREKRYDEALTDLQNVINTNPTLAEAHYLKGQILLSRREVDTALSAYTAAIYWNPRLASAHIEMAKIFLEKNDRARALAHCERALEIDPQNSETLTLKRQVEGK